MRTLDGPSTRFDGGVIRVCQHLNDEHPDGRFVFHDQHHLTQTFENARCRQIVRNFGLRFAVIPGKIQLHGGACAHLGVDANLAARLPCETIDHGESQAGAFAERLGREEGVECACDHLGRHTSARVSHRQGHILAGIQITSRCLTLIERLVCRADGDAAAVGHGIPCIDTEVQKRILELIGVHQGQPKVLGTEHLDADVETDRAANEIFHLGNESIDVSRHGVKCLTTRKCQQAVGERRRAPCSALCGLDVALDAVESALCDANLQHLQTAADPGQQIVEIVCKATRQLAHRLHFLRLTELLLEQALLGHVDADAGASSRAAGFVEVGMSAG